MAMTLGAFAVVFFTALAGFILIVLPLLIYFIFPFIPGIPLRVASFLTLAIPYWYILYTYMTKRK
jgi:hypothetical protein